MLSTKFPRILCFLSLKMVQSDTEILHPISFSCICCLYTNHNATARLKSLCKFVCETVSGRSGIPVFTGSWHKREGGRCMGLGGRCHKNMHWSREDLAAKSLDLCWDVLRFSLKRLMWCKCSETDASKVARIILKENYGLRRSVNLTTLCFKRS